MFGSENENAGKMRVIFYFFHKLFKFGNSNIDFDGFSWTVIQIEAVTEKTGPGIFVIKSKLIEQHH